MSTAKQDGPKAISNPQTENPGRISTHHDATDQRKGLRQFDWKELPAEKEYMLSRFFEIDCENEPLRYEAAIAIGEERVQQGDNMLRKKVAEEGWYAAENGGSSIDPERGSILNQDPSA